MIVGLLFSFILLFYGFGIIAGIIYYVGQFLYIVISIIIYKSKNKHNKKENKIIKKSYEAYNTNAINNPTKNKKQEFYCERCFKVISAEEYELNDCLCEDCFTDINYCGEDF